MPNLEVALGLVNVDRTPFNDISSNGDSEEEDEPPDFDTATAVSDDPTDGEEIDPEARN